MPVIDKRETLQKKQSSSNLQSRLKSRKILGVGATDDGLDVHRSKVSQILGYNENILSNSKSAVGGLLWWNLCLAITFLFWAVWSLVLPEVYSTSMFGGTQAATVLYSVCLICISLPLIAMSLTVVDKNTQMCYLISAEIMLVFHLVGSFYGGAFRVAAVLSFLILANTWYLVTTTSSPITLDILRRFSASREDNISTSYFNEKKTD